MIAGGVFPIAQHGMSRATQQLAEAAENIAAGHLEPKEFVEARLAKHSFDANASVLRTADEMAKSLLDVKA